MRTLSQAWKFCPRCGGDLAWRRTRRLAICASCGRELYNQPKIVVTGLLMDGAGRVLLGRRAAEPHKGKWGTLGGFVEIGESAGAALRRELKEELGIRLGALRYVTTVPGEYPYQGVVMPYLEIALAGRGPDVRAVRYDRKEISALKYFALKDVPFGRLAFRSQRITLRALRDRALQSL